MGLTAATLKATPSKAKAETARRLRLKRTVFSVPYTTAADTTSDQSIKDLAAAVHGIFGHSTKPIVGGAVRSTPRVATSALL